MSAEWRENTRRSLVNDVEFPTTFKNSSCSLCLHSCSGSLAHSLTSPESSLVGHVSPPSPHFFSLSFLLCISIPQLPGLNAVHQQLLEQNARVTTTVESFNRVCHSPMPPWSLAIAQKLISSVACRYCRGHTSSHPRLPVNNAGGTVVGILVCMSICWRNSHGQHQLSFHESLHIQLRLPPVTDVEPHRIACAG